MMLNTVKWTALSGLVALSLAGGSLATVAAEHAAAAADHTAIGPRPADDTVCYRSGRYWICWYE